MKSDCTSLQNADLDYSFHEIYVEFVKKERQIEELTTQVETLNLERNNIQCKFSKFQQVQKNKHTINTINICDFLLKTDKTQFI